MFFCLDEVAVDVVDAGVNKAVLAALAAHEQLSSWLEPVPWNTCEGQKSEIFDDGK